MNPAQRWREAGIGVGIIVGSAVLAVGIVSAPWWWLIVAWRLVAPHY